jgi:hypothetical protein
MADFRGVLNLSGLAGRRFIARAAQRDLVVSNPTTTPSITDLRSRDIGCRIDRELFAKGRRFPETGQHAQPAAEHVRKMTDEAAPAITLVDNCPAALTDYKAFSLVSCLAAIRRRPCTARCSRAFDQIFGEKPPWRRLSHGF